jgi:hypothetical protein
MLFSKIKILLNVLFITGALNAYGFNLGEWQHETPGNNLMGDNGNGNELTIIRQGYNTLPLKKWYFYNYHIVGITGKKYFVVNEYEGDILLFNTENEWHNYLNQNRLNPFIWTRWYSDNWVDMDYIFVFLFFYFIKIIPFFLLLLWTLYKAIKVEHFKMTKPNTLIFLAIISLFILIVILDCFPQSI